MQKPVALLYTNSEHAKKENRKTISFTNALKILSSNLSKEVKKKLLQ
jgi:hypothetical protein